MSLASVLSATTTSSSGVSTATLAAAVFNGAEAAAGKRKGMERVARSTCVALVWDGCCHSVGRVMVAENRQVLRRGLDVAGFGENDVQG